MNKYIAIILLSLLSSSSFAQDKQIGIKAGPSLVNIVGEDARLVEFKPSYHVGALVRIPVAKKLLFQPEILFDAQGGVGDIGNLRAIYKFNYIQLPLLLSYNFHDHFYLDFGPRFGYNLSAKINWSGNDRDFGDMQKVSVGISAGLGYSIHNFLIQLRANPDLTNITDSEQAKHLGLAASVAYLFPMKKKVQAIEDTQE